MIRNIYIYIYLCPSLGHLKLPLQSHVPKMLGLRFECLEMALKIHDECPSVDLWTFKAIIEDWVFHGFSKFGIFEFPVADFQDPYYNFSGVKRLKPIRKGYII